MKRVVRGVCEQLQSFYFSAGRLGEPRGLWLGRVGHCNCGDMAMAGATVGELAREMAAGRVDHLITGSLFRKIRDVKSKLDLIKTDGALDALTEYIRRDATSNAALRAVAQVSLPAAPVSHAAGDPHAFWPESGEPDPMRLTVYRPPRTRTARPRPSAASTCV